MENEKTILSFMEIASAHLRDSDVVQLDEGDLPIDSMIYKYGYVVSTARLIDVEERQGVVQELRDHGMSEEFIAAARKAGEAGCWLLRFEMDADIDDDLAIGRFVDHPDEDDRGS